MHSAPGYLVKLRLQKAQNRLWPWICRALAVGLGLEIGALLSRTWELAWAVPVLLGFYGGLGWLGLRLKTAVGVLNDFNRPGVKDEIQASPLKTSQIVDAVFRCTFLDALRFVAVPLLLLGAACLNEGGPMVASLIVGFALLGLALVIALMMAYQAWSYRSRWFAYVSCLLVAYLGSACLCAFLALGHPGPALASLVGLGAMLGMVGSLRWVAIQGLAHSGLWEARARRWWRGKGGSRARLTRINDWNPVFGRSLGGWLRGRYAGAVHLGGLLLAAGWGATLATQLSPVCLDLCERKLPIPPMALFFTGDFTLLMVLGLQLAGMAGLVACIRGYRLVTAERDSGSLELLRGSQLSPAACLDGWAMSAWFHVNLAAAAVMLFALPLWTLFSSPWMLLGALCVPYLAGLAGAYAGILGSLQKGSRVGPQWALLGFLVIYMSFAALAALMLGPVGGRTPQYELLAPLTVSLVVLGLRYRAVQVLRNPRR